MNRQLPIPIVAAQRELSVPVQEVDFRTVYRQHLTHVWNTLRRFGVPDRDLEDICHDVFVTFYRCLAEYDPTRPVRPWLSGIAFRVASDYRRRAHVRREQVVDEPAALSRELAADERMITRERRDLVIEALQALDEPRRALIIMHEIDEQPMPDIAAVLGVPLNTAYSRLRAARADFAAAVKRLCARGGAKVVLR